MPQGFECRNLHCMSFFKREKRREEKEETAFYQKSENFGDVLESIFQAREIPP